MQTPSAGGRYKIVRIAADGAISAVPVRVMAILLLGNQADIDVQLTNDADGNGTNVISFGAAAEQGGGFVDFSATGGAWFPTKCYCDLTTTNGEAFFWVDD